jgi:peroxin-16
LQIAFNFFEAFGLITLHGFMSAVSTAVGLMTVMNEHIVATAPVGPPGGPKFPPTQDPTFPWPLLISVVKEVEVLVEMGSEYYLGKEHKWTPVATVEAIK